MVQAKSELENLSHGGLREAGNKPLFLKKASKRLEAEETLSKAVGQGSKGGHPNKKPRYDNDTSDLRSFLVKDASAQYGGKKTQRPQPYRSPSRFQGSKYFHRNKPRPSQERQISIQSRSNSSRQ